MTKNSNGKFKLDRSEWFKLILIVGSIAGGIMWRLVRVEAAVEFLGQSHQDLKQDVRELRGKH